MSRWYRTVQKEPTGKDKGSNGGGEPRDERVVRIRTHQEPVDELKDTREHDKDEVGVDELEFR